MGLKKTNALQKGNDKLDDVIDIILELRNDARKNKDFSLSDKIRDMLNKKVFLLTTLIKIRHTQLISK